MADPIELFDALPVPALLIRWDRIERVNRAFRETYALDLAGRRSIDVIDEHLEGGYADEARQLQRARAHDKSRQAEVWMSFADGHGRRRHARIRLGPGLAEEGTVIAILTEAEELALAQGLAQRLAGTAVSLMRCRAEPEVLDDAAALLAEQGVYAAFLRYQDGRLVRDAFRFPPGRRAELVAVLGAAPESLPVSDVLEGLAAEAAAADEARFVQDYPSFLRESYPPDVAEKLAPVSPRRMLLVPIRVEGRPYGAFTVNQDDLTPASAATLTLFGRLIGGAVENARLHTRAADRLDALERLQQALLEGERLATLGRMAEVAAHEIRNPLAVIVNAVALLRRESLAPDAAVAVDYIEEEAGALEHFVRDLVDLSRPLSPRLQPVRVRDLVDRVIAALGRLDLEHVQVESDLARDCTVDGDPDLLEIALLHLLRIATDSAPPGSRVRVVGERTREGCRIAVEDPEPAPDTTEAALFGTRKSGPSLGLGVVQRIVEAHGGRIRFVRSAEGGTRVELLLGVPRDGHPA